jgi:hypothetical protein
MNNKKPPSEAGRMEAESGLRRTSGYGFTGSGFFAQT